MKCTEHFHHFRATFALQFHRHQRRRSLADRATASGELDVLQASARTEFYREMNFVAARWIIAVHPHRCVGQLAEIPRPARMIEDHFLVKLFDFHESTCLAFWLRSIAYAICHVERSETSLAGPWRAVRANDQRFFSRDCRIRMTGSHTHHLKKRTAA